MDYHPVKEVLVTKVEARPKIINPTKRAAPVELPPPQVPVEDHHIRTTTFPRMSSLWIVLIVSIVAVIRMEIVMVTIKIRVEVVSAVSVWTLRRDVGSRGTPRSTYGGV